jgi:hypothetical protein
MTDDALVRVRGEVEGLSKFEDDPIAGHLVMRDHVLAILDRALEAASGTERITDDNGDELEHGEPDAPVPPPAAPGLREALEALVASMTDKAAFQEWTKRQIEAMDAARAALAETPGS